MIFKSIVELICHFSLFQVSYPSKSSILLKKFVASVLKQTGMVFYLQYPKNMTPYVTIYNHHVQSDSVLNKYYRKLHSDLNITK